jgi:cell division inhibitor SepF
MFRDWLKRTRESLRNAMLSPGSTNYDPENTDDDYGDYDDEPSVNMDSWHNQTSIAAVPKGAYNGSKYGDKIVELYGNKNQTEVKAEVKFLTPQNVSQSNVVTDAVKEGIICAVNLTSVEREQCQRIVDVIAGAVYALEGDIARLSKDIFIVAPDGVRITQEMKETLSKGFPWASSR